MVDWNSIKFGVLVPIQIRVVPELRLEHFSHDLVPCLGLAILLDLGELLLQLLRIHRHLCLLVDCDVTEAPAPARMLLYHNNCSRFERTWAGFPGAKWVGIPASREKVTNDYYSARV